MRFLHLLRPSSKTGLCVWTAVLLSACGGRTSVVDFDEWLRGAEDPVGDGDGDDRGDGGGDTGGTGGFLSGTGGELLGTGGELLGTGGDLIGMGGSLGTGGEASGGTGGDATGGTGGTPPLAEEIFVDCDWPDDTGDGSSWASPLRRPDLALNRLEDGGSLYVKEGVCRAPSQGSFLASLVGGKDAFILGGFAGDLMDPFRLSTNRTLFSADILGNDQGTAIGGGAFPDDYVQSHQDNSDVIVGVAGGSTLEIERIDLAGAFNITDGSPSKGAVSLATGATLRLSDSEVSDCTTVSGPAFTLTEATLELSRIEVSEVLTLSSRGALTATQSTVTVTDSHFEQNESPEGSAIWIENSHLNITDSVFESNEAYTSGGVLSARGDETTVIVNSSRFSNNEAAAGGAISQDEGLLQIDDSEFWNNTAKGIGGHIHLNHGNWTTVSRSWFVHGHASQGGQIHLSDSMLSAGDSHFIAGRAFSTGSLWSAHSASGAPEGIELFRCSVAGASAENSTNALSIQGASVSITDSVIAYSGNPSLPVSLTAMSFWNGNLSASRSAFVNNTGNEVIQFIESDSLLVDSYVGENTSSATSSMTLLGASSVRVVGSTLANNTANGASTPAINVSPGSTFHFDNSVLWSSAAPSASPWIQDGLLGTTIAVESSCGPAELLSYGTARTITSSPFARSGSFAPFLLAPTSNCVDAGDANIATTYGSIWSEHSAVFPFLQDAAPIDAGYHVPLNSSPTFELTTSSSGASWSISGRRACRLIIPSERASYQVSSSGSVFDRFPTGTEYFLVCPSRAPGDQPLVLRATK